LTRSALIAPLLPMTYKGHVFLAGQPARMKDHAVRGGLHLLEVPIVLLIGSSMSAGKTSTARVVIRLLKQFGLKEAEPGRSGFRACRQPRKADPTLCRFDSDQAH